MLGSSLLVLACAAKNAPPAPQEKRDPRRVNVTQSWENNCSHCHGMDGKGGGAGTQTLLTEALFDQDLDKRFFDAIKNGVKDTGMTAFGETMSDEEIWSLVVHTRELQARALRTESSRTRLNGVNKKRGHSYRVETVFEEGLKTPWSVDWLPDGRMLVTNRGGRLLLVKGSQATEVTGTPPVLELGQGGLMDVAVHPKYAQNGWIYLSFTQPGEGGTGLTKLVRGKIDGSDWTSQQTLWEGQPEWYSRSGVHFGCRIVFDGKGHLFFCIGERGSGDLAQDLGRPNGKVYRINEDGTVPKDNPFVNDPKAIPAIWSYGHRNPQGLAFGLDGKLWDTEHAPRGGDEVNEVVKGANYGWPLISYGINYNDSPYRTPWPKDGQDFKMPVFRWLPSTGACGLDVARGPMFPGWKGDLIAGGLAGQNVDRIRIQDGKLVEREELVWGIGRVRDVVCGPDGSIYIVLNDPDKVVRLVEAK